MSDTNAGLGTIAVIGSGNIGGSLGRAFARAGHTVVFGARKPDAPDAVTLAEAVAAGETVVLAIPADAVEGFLREHGPALAGKLLLDATNRFPGPVLHSADLVAELAPGARYARAFNSQPWETYVDPLWDGVPGSLFYTVADESDAPTLEALIEAVGLAPASAGVNRPDLLDAALFLLFPSMQKGRHTGLKVLHD
ncbi:NADPH-dependent F420 reductase [Streptacidiphilus rugosus]|uniref:NADPH-dependent F420 reductase n=1 Tax=Streptacidiphilus rugosus TaxID=405783 RepID=UPI000691450E|nr:NAD(P)-binding domain-containing protein [Streptacidiphilus rugosus]